MKIPNLTAAANTTIYMYYGNSILASNQNSNWVWDSTFTGVWHLKEASGAQVMDSTANGNNSQPAGNNCTAGTGQIDGDMLFDEATNRIILNRLPCYGITPMRPEIPFHAG